ncbi:hypothetical protein [Conexibacter woesei]|uniref:Uncharacterized protein n=1 Tax=Conexibacter woesei (strain DSM 14684 / CCUG 47730 / CIP 108061 / JCM 11494 / NBRC 100937 / ID131577) TaxID=469383 RepID=D3FDQ4_CONWI|nr:hypothetical protein [Conexibacter woesei]ADB49628.1 hypothetical protein Cwoe_1199 [Conexibacter woesei DSM 14684]
MSFLIDPALLYAGGRTYRRLAADADAAAPDPARDAAVAVAFMTVFWGVSVGLYLNHGWTKPIWWICRARSGRDWMLNSGVLRIDDARAGRRTHLVSALIFATYPLWLWLGMRQRRGQ